MWGSQCEGFPRLFLSFTQIVHISQLEVPNELQKYETISAGQGKGGLNIYFWLNVRTTIKKKKRRRKEEIKRKSVYYLQIKKHTLLLSLIIEKRQISLKYCPNEMLKSNDTQKLTILLLFVLTKTNIQHCSRTQSESRSLL